MRIVFVAYHGSEHTRRWVGFFAERGHEVHVVTCGDTPSGADVARGRYTVHDLGRPLGGKAGYLLRLPRARSLVRSLRPDVVHAHHATSYGLLAAGSGRRPLAVTCHGSDVLRSPRNPLLRVLVTWTLRRAGLVTVPGEHVRRAVERLAGDRVPVHVLQYGVDVDALERLGRAERGRRSGGAARIATARPLTPLYRTADVVRAVALLRERGVDVAYDLAGDGPERARLERLVGELGLSGVVTLHGRLGEEEALRLLAGADVYVSVAESDGVSIALLEALAVGCVPVLSDIPANRAWVRDGESGVLVAIEPGAVADGVQRALALDREHARRTNLDRVRRDADRARNLAVCEALLERLVAGDAVGP